MHASFPEHPEYQIVRELGRGGMGVVYLAENQLMGRNMDTHHVTNPLHEA